MKLAQLGWLTGCSPAFPGMRTALTLEGSVSLGAPGEAPSVGCRNLEGMARKSRYTFHGKWHSERVRLS